MADTATTAPTTPSGFDRLLHRAARTASVTLALDPNDAERHAEARAAKRRAAAEVDRATASKDADRIEAAQAALDEATEALATLEAEIVTFTIYLSAVGAKRVEELMLEHRPTDKQKRAARSLNNGDPKAEPQFNEDTFPPALLAEEITTIEFSDGDSTGPLSVQQLAELWADRWPQGDKVQIIQTAMLVNQAPSSVGDLGKG